MRGQQPNFVAPAELMGHPARSAMLLALRDGRTLPMSMLASEAGVAPSTASEHLTKLTEGRLVRSLRRGRRCYFSLASPEVVHAMDALAQLAPADLAATPRPAALHQARTCYDHLAGNLAVAMTRSLRNGGVLTEDARVSRRGQRLLDDFGVRVDPSRRRLVGYCADWDRQRTHLGGALGAALLRRFTELDWLRTQEDSPRVLVVTALGRRGFARAFGIGTPTTGAIQQRPTDDT